ncbi:hypothetical protein L6164_029285 [Bauhinia variegata]|uniref:Uncharacterized protein n=1 Tax=Bauhinia variegata TaxID=167791 RepID=A0ACB9L8T9_BAUVA|nr:hypothetical protein L6164_029285 [Bauhinia variegata]
MDVKIAFLHGDLEENIYMKQPKGFVVKGKEDYVCKLTKSLYGLKQAPRQWYKKFESVMIQQGYKKTISDHCAFVRKFSNNYFIILMLYVDDMLIVGHDSSRINLLKKEFSKSFAMKDLGPARQILGIEIIRDRKSKKLWLSQEKYIEKVLQRFHMNKAKAVSTPLANHFKLSTRHAPSDDDEKARMQHIPYRPAVGSLMYAMVCTRPDIAHEVGVVSRFLSNPGREHWNAVKGAIAWQSKLQKCVALSTTEVEFIATTEACKKLLWMKKFICELGFTQKMYILYCDSQSAIYLCKNPTFHGRSKHIDVKYHWIRDVLDSRSLELVKIHTNDNCSDMLTKILPRGKFEACCVGAGLAHTPT